LKRQVSTKFAIFTIISVLFLVVVIIVFFYNEHYSASASTVLYGDMYYSEIGNNQNIKASQNSVIITSGQSVTIEGKDGAAFWRIPQYTLSNKLNWNSVTKQMDRNISRLNKEKIRSSNKSGSRTLSGNQNINPSGKPEGDAWLVQGDLSIGGVNNELTVNGKGTYIVEGNLLINNNISYANNFSSIGFIVNGDIIIDSRVNALRGAYYAPNGKTIFK